MIENKTQEAIMGLESCIFCKIIAGTLPATVIAQTESVLVIADIYPEAPIHYLAIPKEHISDISGFQPHHAQLTYDLLDTARTVMNGKDFRLLVNNGASAGQSVFHFHYHILAGKTFNDF